MPIVNTAAGYRWGDHNDTFSYHLSSHCCDRLVERLKEVGVQLPDAEAYYQLGLSGLKQIFDNEFVTRYVSNMMSKQRYQKFVIHDNVNGSVFTIGVNPEDNSCTAITFGMELVDKWDVSVNQRLCWLYKDAFVFSTSNGNVTWVKY